MDICQNCKEREIQIKKWKLCCRCYQRQRKQTIISQGFFYSGPNKTSKKLLFKREMEFVKNYFRHHDWLYLPATFRVENTTYSPDFYDVQTNTFIEVAGTRQAFHNNMEKYLHFIKTYPDIKFEVRKMDGTLIDLKNPTFGNGTYKKRKIL